MLEAGAALQKQCGALTWDFALAEHNPQANTMEDFLQRTKTKLSRSKHLDKVHVVLGKKSCDLDSLISALAYAYYLEKVSPSNIVCLPVLNISRREICYHPETRFILEKLNIPESLHIFRDEINLNQLNSEGKLLLTLVHSSTLTSEDKNLESAVVKVIIPKEQNELLDSASCLVAKELLRKAPELITQPLAHLLRGSILSKIMDEDALKIPEEKEEVLLCLEEKFPELSSRKDIITFLQEAQLHADELRIEEALVKDLKEVSDGEIKVAVSTIYINLEDYLFHRNINEDLKAFVDKYGFDVLVISASYLSEGQEKKQIAVYSENMELGNQICCELEECQNPCLELDPMEYGCDQLLIYQQENYVANGDEIFLLMKDVISRRHPEMAPNSRTSSTEAVAGSAPLSQGSSGIMELYGSDIEAQANVVNFIENPQDHNGSVQAHADVNIDLVSPDSGLATIRSSRSSKESSVFLSDDSPVAEGGASHHSFLSGFDSYSPIPEGAVAEEEKPPSRNSSDNYDLFNFDLAPVPSVETLSSHLVDCSVDDFSHDSGSSEEQLSTSSKADEKTNLSECDIASYSIDFRRKNEYDYIVTLNESGHQEENHKSFSDNKSNLVDLENEFSSCPEILKSGERRTPPTPRNSLVETSPLDSGPPLFYPQDIIERINEIDNVKNPHSRIRYRSWWDGFELDSKNVDAWNSTEPESVFQNPDSWKDYKVNLLLRQQADRRASDSACIQKQPKHMEFSRTDTWKKPFSPAQNTLKYQEKDDEQQIEEFANVWNSSEPACGEWNNSGHIKTNLPNVWAEFDHDNSRPTEHPWNVPQVEFDHFSQNFDKYSMSKSLLEFSVDDLSENPKNQIDFNSQNNRQDSSLENHMAYNYAKSNFGIVQKDVKLIMENHSNTKSDNTTVWDPCDSNIRKDMLGNLGSWEDPFLSYKDPEFVTSNIDEDLIVSPPDTNYSTSDSYVSPTGVGDEKESENKYSDRKSIFDQIRNSNSDETGTETYDLTDNKSLPETFPVCSSDYGEAWKLTLNNEKQVEVEHFELNIKDDVVYDSEQKVAEVFTGDYDVDDSSPSENSGMMMIPAQKDNNSSLSSIVCTMEENGDRNNEIICEDIGSPCFEPNDTENDILVNYQLRKKNQSDQENKLLNKQFDQKSEHLRHNQEVVLEDNSLTYSSALEIIENKTIVGSLPLNDVRNETMQNDMPLSLLLPLSYVNSSEESRTISDYPSSPEKTITSGSLEEVAAKPLEVNIPFSNWTHLITEEKNEVSQNSNAKHVVMSPKEDNDNLDHVNMIEYQSYHSGGVSTLVSKPFDKDLSEHNILDMESPSSISPREECNQSKPSPMMVENQNMMNRSEMNASESEQSNLLNGKKQPSIGAESTPNLNTDKFELESCEEISEILDIDDTSSDDENQGFPQNLYAEHIEPLNTTDKPQLNNLLPYKADSSELSDTPESVESENEFTHEKCINIILHHELSQILDAWNTSVSEENQFDGLSPMKNEMSEGSSNSPANTSLKITGEEDNSSGGSITNDIYSGPTSPEISDSSTNIHTRENFQGSNNQSESIWDVTNDIKIDESGKEFLGNKSQEDSEINTDHKVPKNLVLWNAHVDDDTSSLSSPGTDEISECSNIHQGGIESDLDSDKLEDAMREKESLHSNETNSIIGSKNSNSQPELKENVHMDALNKTSEDINVITEDCAHETSECSIEREIDQDDVHNHIEETSAINNEEIYRPNNLDVWDILLQDNAKSALDENKKYVEECFGFPDDAFEWWNLEKQNENSLGLNFRNDIQRSYAGVIPDNTWAVNPKINEKVEEPNLTAASTYEIESTQCNNIHENKHEEPVLTHRYEGSGQACGNIGEYDGLPWPHIDETERRQEPSLNTIKQTVPEDWQTSPFNAVAREDLKLDPSMITRNRFVTRVINQYSEMQPETINKSSSDRSLSLTKPLSSTPTEERISPGNPFVPDILQNSTPGNCQTFSIGPDLWTDVDQPFILKTSRENPDILNHFDQDSSSQASSSPDVCQYETKETYAQTSVSAEQEESGVMSPILLKDSDFHFNQQLAIDRVELCPEENDSCLSNKYEKICQGTSPNGQLSEAEKENINQESILATDNFMCDNFPGNDKLSAIGHVTELGEQLKTVHTAVDDTGKEYSMIKVPMTNNKCIVLNETNPLTVIDESEKIEIHPTLTKKQSPQASLEEKEEVLYNTEIQCSADSLHLQNTQENYSPEFIESPHKQLTLAGVSPFGLDTLQKDGMNISESNTTVIKDDVAEYSQQGWGSLLLESDGTPGSSCTLKAFEFETDSSNIESPVAGSEIDILESKATGLKGEVAEDQENQGWESFLLESDEKSQPSCILKKPIHEIYSNSIDSPTSEDENNLLENKSDDVNSKAGESSENWDSLVLDSEIMPELTDHLNKCEYKAKSTHIDSPADGVISVGNGDNEAVCDVFNFDSKVTKFPERTRKDNKEDRQFQEAEEQFSLEMDYVLISGEEHVSLTKDLLVTQESNFLSAVAEQMDSLETFSADSSDTLQSISIINESEAQSTLENEWDSFYLEEKCSPIVPQKWEGEKKSRSILVQDQVWTIVGQNGEHEVSSEDNCSKPVTIESLCRQSIKELDNVLSQELISETQIEIPLDKSSYQAWEQQDKISCDTKTDAPFLQVVATDTELDDHPQLPGDSMVKEQEIEDEIPSLDNERQLHQTVGLVPEDVGMDILNKAMLDSTSIEMRPEPPNSLDLNGSHPRRIKLTAPNINLSLDQSEGSVLSDENLDTPDEIDINVDDLDTPDEADSLEYAGHEEQPAVKEPSQEESESIPEYTAEEEREDNKLWRTVVIGDQEQRIDMKAIEPFKKVISHGGYYGDGLNAIIVFAACFLPDSSQTDYTYVMENLFLYVISTLELMVAEDYMIVYLNGATPRRRMPGLGWMKRCYQMIDRRLRKNLKSFIIVHPSWFIRTILAVTRPFISSKFSHKIQYVNTLADLNELIPMEYVNVPESIVKYDEERSIQRRVRLDEELKEASANINMTMKSS